MSVFNSKVHEARGPLTEEDLIRSMEKIAKQPPQVHHPITTVRRKAFLMGWRELEATRLVLEGLSRADAWARADRRAYLAVQGMPLPR